MNSVSADKPKTWETRPERPLTLEIVLLKRTYLLPWSQFLYAEGDNDELRISFPMHEITIRGAVTDRRPAKPAVLEKYLPVTARLTQQCKRAMFTNRNLIEV